MKKGICIAGNILVDYVKKINGYPQKGMLSSIVGKTTLAGGGAAHNTPVSLAKVDGSIPIKVYGLVGNDEAGHYLIDTIKANGIDVSGVKVSEDYPTSFSDVMTEIETGDRTFFHNRGANAEFCIDDVDVDALDCDIFHIGYLMLLDKFDEIKNGTTDMATLLKAVQAKGIKTSIDLVSENSGNFNKVVKCALPYCDYVIINEVEAGKIVGIDPEGEDGTVSIEAIEKISRRLMSFGVKEKVIIHCPKYGFCLDKSGAFTVVESKKLPKGFIKGSVGAGDAFCAGVLYGLYYGSEDKEMLSFANLVAISCLSAADSVSGVKPKEEILKMQF